MNWKSKLKELLENSSSPEYPWIEPIDWDEVVKGFNIVEIPDEEVLREFVEFLKKIKEVKRESD